MAQLNFDSSTVEPSKSFAPIPAGVYPAQIVDSEMKPLKSGNGNGLSLQFEILGNQHAGRRIFANLNIHHSNKEAERIAQEQLSAICHAVGVRVVQDSSQLHNKPLNVRVKIRKQDGYEDRNEISGYEALPGGAAPVQRPVQQAASAAAQSTAPRKPWERAA
jgi:hypothetical protein